MSAWLKSWRGPPLALQIVALLLGGLVVAQLVTLLLTLLLPPAPAPLYGLDDIASALADRRGDDHRGLQRIVQPGPPAISGPGWLISEKSRLELAMLMHVDPKRVALAFYTPLPFAGTAATRAYAMADDGGAARPIALGPALLSPGRLVLAQFSPPGGQAGPMMRGDRILAPPRDTFPPGMFPGSGRLDEVGRGRSGGPNQAMPQGGWQSGGAQGGGWGGARGSEPLIRVDPRAVGDRGSVYVPGDGGAAVPPLLRGGVGAAAPPFTGPIDSRAVDPRTDASGAESRIGDPRSVDSLTSRQIGAAERLGTPPGGFQPPGAGGIQGAVPQRFAFPNNATLLPPPQLPVADPPARLAPLAAGPDGQSSPPRAPGVIAPRPILPDGAIGHLDPLPPVPPLLRAPAAPPPEYSEPPSGPPIAINAPARSLFGLAPAPFVEGDFVAALRMADGRWSVVQPAPAPFPNSWQRRVLLWFALSLAVVTPLGWLFARRLVTPLDRFARAAEQLGRDPTIAIGPLDGPAEIGRAAHAFNLMQGRLRAFVDDRTAMVGAISHDLRTPLTRMRFRIEDVPDDVRDGLLEEVDEMEAMIAQVIDYIRDASMPGARERLDLATLVEEAAADARMVGGNVVIEQSDPAPVEVDVLGVRRLLDNLLENAIKYGDRARIRLRTEAGSAIAEILDAGPGLPADEIERAFEPFYRSDAARSSAKSGSGLGLAVCRSIARAHGGEVFLRQSGDGFLAEVRMPLAYDAERPVPA